MMRGSARTSPWSMLMVAVLPGVWRSWLSADGVGAPRRGESLLVGRVWIVVRERGGDVSRPGSDIDLGCST
jgi:hypothetical protein